jgi:soluble lytic murein transglycosylase-like protein
MKQMNVSDIGMNIDPSVVIQKKIQIFENDMQRKMDVFDQMFASQTNVLKIQPSIDSSPNVSSQKTTDEYQSIIEQASVKYNVPVDLIKAVISAESDYNPNSVSKSGASGLMQLMPGTAKGLGVVNTFDPRQNIDGGTHYLKSMLDQFKDTKLALAAYNAGPNAVIKYNGIPPYSETQNYVKKIMKQLQPEEG